MSDVNAHELLRISDKLFSDKLQLDELHQSIAEEFYPERADFTETRTIGDEYADNLYESTPAQNHRDLSFAMGALNRPKGQQWWDQKAQDDWRNTDQARNWLSRARDRQRSLLYLPRANFQMAMQISDKDFTAFGNAVIENSRSSVGMHYQVYKTHHLRDCAWQEDEDRVVYSMHRRYKLRLSNWKNKFPKVPLPKEYSDIMKKDPYHQIDMVHICFPNKHYDAYKKTFANKKYASVHIDRRRISIVEESGYNVFPYRVRRWFLHDNSQYGYSPASMLGLIDGRLLQSQSRIILDAGERVVDPPLMAVYDAVLGPVANHTGAMNWINGEYDQRQGRAIEALDTRANIPLGLEMKQDTRELLAAAWFINKLTLPAEKDMTAFEVNERLSEYIRSIGPVSEPFEDDNKALLDQAFEFNLSAGNFGPVEAIPPELRGSEIEYEFDGPIQIAYRRQKLQRAREVVTSAGEIANVKPEVLDNYDFDQIARDSSEFIGAEPGWMVPEELVAQSRQVRADAMKKQQELEESAVATDNLDKQAQMIPNMEKAAQSLENMASDADFEEMNPEEAFPDDPLEASQNGAEPLQIAAA